MNTLSKLINLRKYLSSRCSNKGFPNDTVVSNSELTVEKTANVESVQVNTLDFEQKNQSIATKKSEESVQWSSQMQSLLEKPPSNLPTHLILGSMAFFLSFSTWAWFGKIENTGKAHGKLIPKGETYKIESLNSAKVSQIAVKEGESVKEGQLLASLDFEQEQREVSRLEEMLDSYQSELNQKYRLLEKAKLESKSDRSIAFAEIQAQKSIIESAIAKAQVIKKLLAQQQSELSAYISRQRLVKDLDKLEQEKLAQIHFQLREHQQRIERIKPLLEQGAITQEAMFQATQARHQAQQQLIDSKLQGISNISEQIFQSEQSLREMRASITQNQGELVSAQKEIERLQTELVYKTAQKQKVELESQQKIQQLQLEINQTRTEIAETKNQLANAKSQLEKRFLRSPVAGTVLAFNVTNTGRVVQSGETVAEIAPHGSPLVLSAMLPNREAGFVEPGMKAQVKFDAYSYQDYGTIPGQVRSVSADSKTDEKLGAVYQVEIELERNYVTDDLKKILFKPGQTAAADIVIRRRRVADILLDPIKKLEKDGIDL